EIYGEGNTYSAEYWMYDSRLGRRWNLDPVKKHHESSYATFANNPIWFIDPFGLDTLKVNKYGYVSLHSKVEGSETDVLVKIKGRNGKVKYKDGELKSKSISNVPKDFMKNKSSTSFIMSDEGVETKETGTYHFLSKDYGIDLYKWLADNTKVEWSFTYFEKFETINTIISTTHSTRHEALGSYIALDLPEHSLIMHIHSHGKASEGEAQQYLPSDFKGRDSDDIGFRTKILLKSPNAELLIYSRGGYWNYTNRNLSYPNNSKGFNVSALLRF